MKKILLSLLLAGGVQNSFAIKCDPASSRLTEPALLELNEQLLQAVVLGNTAVVKDLIVRGVDVNVSTTCGTTVLMCAAACGYTETTQLLIAAGADVNARNNYGSTALIWAATNNRSTAIEIIKLLISAGADVNASDRYGETALMIAKEKCRTEILQLLRAHGASE